MSRTMSPLHLPRIPQIVKAFIAQHGPVIILLDNLHNFDPLSWRLLYKLSHLLGSHACLVVATARPMDELHQHIQGPG